MNQACVAAYYSAKSRTSLEVRVPCIAVSACVHNSVLMLFYFYFIFVLSRSEIRVIFLSMVKLLKSIVGIIFLDTSNFILYSNNTKRQSNKQKRSTEGCSKFKSPETRQVQERLVSTLEHMQVPKWDQDQVSGGVSVLCWHAAPVAYVLWKPCTIR